MGMIFEMLPSACGTTLVTENKTEQKWKRCVNIVLTTDTFIHFQVEGVSATSPKEWGGCYQGPCCPLVLLNESTLHTHDDSVCSVFWHLLPERLEWHRATHLNCKWAVCFPQSTNRIWEHSPNYEETGLYLWQSVRPTRAELKAWSPGDLHSCIREGWRRRYDGMLMSRLMYLQYIQMDGPCQLYFLKEFHSPKTQCHRIMCQRTIRKPT